MTEYPTNEDVCNLALGRIGEWVIDDIYADGQAERLCRLHLPQVRRSLLRRMNWDFAIERKALDSVPAAAFGESYKHELPCDYIALMSLHGDLHLRQKVDIYEIEGLYVLSDYSELYLRYIKDQDDPRKWSVDFLNCAVVLLASKLAQPLGAGAQMEQSLLAEVEQLLTPLAMENEIADNKMELLHPRTRIKANSQQQPQGNDGNSNS